MALDRGWLGATWPIGGARVDLGQVAGPRVACGAAAESRPSLAFVLQIGQTGKLLRQPGTVPRVRHVASWYNLGTTAMPFLATRI